ncbi:MAG: hypothetical protein C0463_07890 [Idiomarina sp.]|nr:hypothetical protein [Idiomarina sp.]
MATSFDDQATMIPGSDGEPSRPANSAQFPFPINPRYQAIELIGHGSSGAVYRAYDQQLKREVAIKFIHRSQRLERQRLLAEGRVLAQFSHPNICRVYEVAEEGYAVYMVMSLIKGQTLDHWREHFSQRQLLACLVQICDAIAEAHRKDILHCDIKPSNIVIQPDVTPLSAVLVDFGIADSQHYASASGIGTEHYMAPERFEPNCQPTRAIDMYALGATMRVLLTGAHDSDGLAQLPTDLRLIITHCLQPNPDQRYSDAAALASDLRAYLDRRPISLRKGLAYRTTRMWQRHRWLRVTSVSAAGIALAAVVGLGFYQAEMQQRQYEQAQLHAEVTRLEGRIDSIYRSPPHAAAAELAAMRAAAERWIEQSAHLPQWMAARHYAAAGVILARMGYHNQAHAALLEAWALGERSDTTAMALASVHQSLFTIAQSQALNLPSASQREAAVDQAHREFRQPALDYLNQVNHSELPTDYLRAMRAYLEGDEAQARRILITGSFPAWFYQHHDFHLNLLQRQMIAVLLGRAEDDIVALYDELQQLSARLLSFTPSSSANYITLASVYNQLKITKPSALPYADSDYLARVDTLIAVVSTLDPEHPHYHLNMGSLLIRQLSTQPSEQVRATITRATRHYELAIRYARQRDLPERTRTVIYSAYLNAIRAASTELANLGFSTASLQQRYQEISQRIPSKHQGAQFHLGEARRYRHLAQQGIAAERDHHWQLAVDSARTAHAIAPNIPTIQANLGLELSQRAVYLPNTQALPILHEAIEHFEASLQQVGQNPAIFYNYAYTSFRVAKRMAHTDPNYERVHSEVYALFKKGMAEFPNIDFFNQLAADMVLYNPPPELAQLSAIERAEFALDLIANSSQINPGLSHIRNLVAHEQLWRLRQTPENLTRLRELLHTTFNAQYRRAYPVSTAFVLLHRDALDAEFDEYLETWVQQIPDAPALRDISLTPQLLGALVSALLQQDTEDLELVCAELSQRDLGNLLPVSDWYLASRTSAVAQRFGIERCSAPQSMHRSVNSL